MERRRSFSFAYFNRPISRTQSFNCSTTQKPYGLEYNGKGFKHGYPCVSGDYAEIDFTSQVPPQDDNVFETAPSGPLAQDDCMMECDVDSDYALTNGSPVDDGDFDFGAVANKCERDAPGEDK